MQDTFLPLLGERKDSFEYKEEKIEVCVFFLCVCLELFLKLAIVYYISAAG